VSVAIDNGDVDYPDGDEVQTIEPWKPPEIWAGLDDVTQRHILDVIGQGLNKTEQRQPLRC
jgi:hypothetical protein